MNRSSRLHRGRPRRMGEETRMHVRRSAALVMSAALVLVACGGDDDDGGAEGTDQAPATTAAGGEGGATTEAGWCRHTTGRRWWRAATASSACPGTTTRKSAGRSGTSRPCKAAIEAGGGTLHLERRQVVGRDTGQQRREPHLPGRQRARHPRPGRHGHQAVRGRCRRERHPGHRLRPAHRGSVGALRHVRQRQGR